MKANLLIILLSISSFALAQKRESEVLNNGVETHYTIYGKGSRTLLIINGGPGMNSEGFESLAKQFAGLYNLQVITYDQRGTGKSKIANPSNENVSMELMLSDIEAIRNQEGIEAWSMFGQSFGGMLAAYYASKFPERIDKLILSSSGGMRISDLSSVNIMGKLTQVERDSFNYWNGKLQYATSNKELRYKRNLYMASAYLVGDEYIPAIAERLGQVNMEMNRMVLSDMYRTGFDCSEDLRTFDKPTLILIGDDDIVSLDVAKETNELLANSKLVIVPSSGHYGWLENPDVYFGAITSFMRG